MKCRHPLSRRERYVWRVGGGDIMTWFDCASFEAPDVEFCLMCNDYLPLGHSDEVPVAVEIRAAFLASQWDPNDGHWDGFVSLGMCSPEAEHAPLIEADIASGRKYQRDLDDYYAGHLARVIAIGDEDHG